MPLSIRRATPDDADTLSVLASRTFVETFGHLYPAQDLEFFLRDAYAPEKQAVILAHPDYAVWLLEEDGVAVGHAAGAALFQDANPELISECLLESGGRNKLDPWALLRRWRENRPVAVINLSQSVRLALAACMRKLLIMLNITLRNCFSPARRAAPTNRFFSILMPARPQPA